MNSSTENKIILAANEAFALLGFHGSTIDRIACSAGVNKAAIHYYFRTKENLYAIILKQNLTLLNSILDSNELKIRQNNNSLDYQEQLKNLNIAPIAWFIINEINVNNQIIMDLNEIDNKIKSMIDSIFNDQNKLKTIERLVVLHLNEIISSKLQNKKNVNAKY